MIMELGRVNRTGSSQRNQCLCLSSARDLTSLRILKNTHINYAYAFEILIFDSAKSQAFPERKQFFVLFCFTLLPQQTELCAALLRSHLAGLKETVHSLHPVPLPQGRGWKGGGALSFKCLGFY